MLNQINFSSIKIKDLKRFRESYIVMADCEPIGILIIPNTDYISDQSKSLAETSNTVMPDPTRDDEEVEECHQQLLENVETSGVL